MAAAALPALELGKLTGSNHGAVGGWQPAASAVTTPQPDQVAEFMSALLSMGPPTAAEEAAAIRMLEEGDAPRTPSSSVEKPL